jgi:hypothetical protein
MQRTLFEIIKFQTPQAWNSWNNLLVLASTFQLHIILHYASDVRGDVLDIVVYHNIRLSQDIVTNILDLDHLPIMFEILDPAKTREASDPV